MKRLLTSLVVLSACGIGLPLVAQDEKTNAATIFAGSVRGIPGSTVRVPLSLTHKGEASALQFDLNYPAAKLSSGLLQSGLFSNNVVLRSRQIAPGQHRILVYNRDLAQMSTNSFIGRLLFSVPAGDLSAGGPVTISNALISTASATEVLPINLISGMVLVGPVSRDDDGVVDVFLKVQSNRTYVIQATTNFVNWVNLSTHFATLDYIIARDFEAVPYQARFYRAAAVTTLPFDRTLNLQVVSNQTYVLQASTNLVNWVNLSTNFTAQNFIVVHDPEWLFYPMRFYRAAMLGLAAAGGQISGLNLQSGNQIVFGYASTAGRSYVLQASTNLTSWNDVTTNLADGTLLNFTNLISPGASKQFFRIMELP